MKVTATDLPGVLVLEPQVFEDDRGWFAETYRADRYAAVGIRDCFVQDNHSQSRRGVLRGLHGQRRRPQAKLVRVVAGEIFDVAVDVRLGSPTFGRWVGILLSSANRRQCYVPVGFLHGFCVLSETAEVEYKCSEVYLPEDEIGVRWDDPALGIAWPVRSPILSPKDAALPFLDAVRAMLPRMPGDPA